MIAYKFVAAGAVLAAMPLAGLAALTHYHHGHGQMMQKFVEWRIDEELTELKATDSQKQQVKAIEDSLFAECPALKTGQRDFRKAVLAELEKDHPDPAKVHALVDARIAAWKTFADKVTDGALKAHDVLTTEQRAQLFKKMERRRARREERE